MECFYQPSSSETLRQCEIISDIKQVVVSPGTAALDEPVIEVVNHPFAIILTQDCDLEQDYLARTAKPVQETNLLPNILFGEARLPSEMRKGPKMASIWKQITQNNHERYQFLGIVNETEDSLTEGFEGLIIDFRRHFTIPTDDVYEQLRRAAHRRCVLVSPYLEHVSSRFSYYQSRVALPMQHLEKGTTVQPTLGEIAVPRQNAGHSAVTQSGTARRGGLWHRVSGLVTSVRRRLSKS